MDNQKKTREKRGSILKSQSSFNVIDTSKQETQLHISDHHVHIDNKVLIVETNANNQRKIEKILSLDQVENSKEWDQACDTLIPDEPSLPEVLAIHRPTQKLGKLSEAQLIKLSLKYSQNKQPQIWEEDDQDEQDIVKQQKEKY